MKKAGLEFLISQLQSDRSFAIDIIKNEYLKPAIELSEKIGDLLDGNDAGKISLALAISVAVVSMHLETSKQEEYIDSFKGLINFFRKIGVENEKNQT